MSQAIRDAAQALIDCYDDPKLAGQMHQRIEALVSALSAPQPTADERVAEHMRLVAAYGAQVQRDAFSGASLTLKLDAQEPDYSRIVAVEQSARALLSASQEDAEHAAMYRWLRERGGASWRIYPEGRPREAVHAIGKYYDEAVRAAMKETKE